MGLKTNYIVQRKVGTSYTGGCLQLTTTGKEILCTCNSKINVVNIATGEVLRTFEQGEEDIISAFNLSLDDKLLITAGQSGLIKLWTWDTGECTKTWKSQQLGVVNHVSIDSTGVLAATASADSGVKVWDIVRHYVTHNFTGAQGPLSVLQFHPETSRLQLFGAGTDCRILVWHLTSSETKVLAGHYGMVTSLCFSESGDIMLSSGRDQVVMIWDLNKFESIRTVLVFEVVEAICLFPENETFPELDINKNGLYFVTAGEKGTLVVWDSEDGKPVYSGNKTVVSPDSPVPEGASLITSLELNIPQRLVVMTTFEHTVLVYNLDDLQLKKQLTGYNDDVLSMDFVGTKDTHIAVATNSSNIKLFQVETFDCKLLQGHRNTVMCLQTFPTNRNMFASGSKDMTVRVWLLDQETGEAGCVAMAEGHAHNVQDVACSRMNTRMLVSVAEDQCLKVWDIPKSVGVGIPEFPRALKTNSTVVAHDKILTTVGISPNDKLIVTGSKDKTAKVWSVDCALLGTLKGHRRPVWSVDFSPVDQVVVTSSGDESIKIWGLADFSCLKTFEGHECSVTKVRFLSRGLQLISSDARGMVKMWTIKLNVCVKTFDEHQGNVWALTTTAKGDKMATGSADSTIIIWKDVTEEEEIEERKKSETFMLQEQELMNLLQAKKYRKALGLAITLEQPYRALGIIKQILLENGREGLTETLDKMRDDQIEALLKFAVQWNCNSKHSWSSQLVIHHVLSRYTVQQLLEHETMKANILALKAYTERHNARLTRLLQSTSFINYTYSVMKM